MLETLGVVNLDEKDLKILRRNTKKTQIFLFDTKRRINPYINMLRHRYNGGYEDIPHFIISKSGLIYKVFNTNYYSKTFGHPNDKRLIKIAIENLGWLRKNTITGVLNNWLNEPFRGETYIRSWRGHFFWDKYTEQQLSSIKSLSKHLSEEYKIPYETISSSGYLKNISKFNGIVCKSNFQTIYKDINPSFDYKIFKNEE